MAAVPRSAVLVGSAKVAPRAQLLELRVDEEPAGFSPRAGQYVILDTGITVGDKRIKRAYSLLGWDPIARTTRILVRRHAGGLGSPALCDAELGTRFSFSGAWGQLGKSTLEHDRDVLLVATHNGITAALGLAGALASRLRVLWLVPGDDYFVPEAYVREALAGAALEVVRDDLEERVLTSIATEIHLAGDGAILVPLAERLAAPGRSIQVEAFFNNPNRKAA